VARRGTLNPPTAHELLALRFVLDERGRMLGTNEPPPRGRAPRLTRIVTATEVAWALRADVDDAGHATIETGPTFLFPDQLPAGNGIVEIAEHGQLTRHFRGWLADELPQRSPILAICDGHDAVSVCFCARRTDRAAEAGVETARDYRGRGYAPLVTAAWAAAVRASGRVPLYSTQHTNVASLAVARKLGLVAYAVELNVLDDPCYTNAP
jgi:hypothetical protein